MWSLLSPNWKLKRSIKTKNSSDDTLLVRIGRARIYPSRIREKISVKGLQEEGEFDNSRDTYICKSLTLTTFPKVPSPRVASTLSAIEKWMWVLQARRRGARAQRLFRRCVFLSSFVPPILKKEKFPSNFFFFAFQNLTVTRNFQNCPI